ncbi:ubiquinol oxidase subunit II [Desulfopila inferna]|nr:ubiquinol oxidase subunit II [Desulfopila inferna]MBM9605644.1 ubiquinol oxidase subunit II [Desulfopila inferna]
MSMNKLSFHSPKAKIMATFFWVLISFCSAALLGGCSEMVLLNPKGPVGETERFVIIVAFILMLIVVIPVIIMAFSFPWKYRASNTTAKYLPKWSYSGRIELVIWLTPAVIVIGLGTLIWNATFELDPYRPLDSDAEPVTIEAISLDWKWLFIYPEQNIAVVNEIVFPTDVPLNFRITSDTVMTSFFIPQLGSQIYAMAGMATKLHLLASEPGVFAGQNQQFSGSGYSYMNFTATATSPEQYEAWLQKIRNSPEALDIAKYEELVEPTPGYPVTYFSSVKANLFEDIMAKYNASGSAKDAIRRKSVSMPVQNVAGLEGE